MDDRKEKGYRHEAWRHLKLFEALNPKNLLTRDVLFGKHDG
jgi:hypothetical protein